MIPLQYSHTMIEQLIIGSILMVLTIVTHSGFIGFSASFTDKHSQWFKQGHPAIKNTIAISIVVLWLLFSITTCTWLWAATYIILGTFNTIEPAVYFSLVTMTTLGFGDITLDAQWRVLSGLTAVNGLLLFGLTTAFLVEFIFQIRKARNS